MNKKIFAIFVVSLIGIILLSSVAAFSILSLFGLGHKNIKENKDSGSTIDNSLANTEQNKAPKLVATDIEATLNTKFAMKKDFYQKIFEISDLTALNRYTGYFTINMPKETLTTIYKKGNDTYIRFDEKYDNGVSNNCFGIFYKKDKKHIYIKTLLLKVKDLTDALYWARFIHDLGKIPASININFTTNNCKEETGVCILDFNNDSDYIVIEPPPHY